MEAVLHPIVEPLKFCHLHGHTIFSKLDALAKPDALMQRCKELGMDVIAVTEHGRANSWYSVTEAAKKVSDENFKMKVILGCEVYLTDDMSIHKNNEMKAAGYANYHMVMLPYTQEGFRNLQRIVSDASLHGGMHVFQYTPRIDLKHIREHGLGKGIIVTTACLAGKVSKTIQTYVDRKTGEPIPDQPSWEEKYAKAEAHIQELCEIFDEVYLELQDNNIQREGLDQYHLNNFLIDYSKKTGLPLVFTKDYHYIEKEDRKFHDLWKLIGDSSKMEKLKEGEITFDMDSEDLGFKGDPVHLASPEEMWESVQRGIIPPEAYHNTMVIAKKCTENIPEGQHSFLPTKQNLYPKFKKLPEGISSADYMVQIAREGLEQRFREFEAIQKPYDRKVYEERLEYEMKVINDKGYADYFLILWDAFKFCKENNIPTGPGRGSAAGALLAYSLRITLVDPIEHGLLFERFLNPERKSAPDWKVA